MSIRPFRHRLLPPLRRTALLAGLAGLSAAWGADIAFPRDYHGNEAPRQAGAGWLALEPAGRGWQLRAVELSLKPVFDPVLDEDGQATGIRPGSPDDGQVLAYLRGRELKPGPVVSVLSDWPLDFILGQDRRDSLRLGARQYRLETGPIPGGTGVTLTEGRTRQPLATLTEDGWRVLWAGDLDGDTRLDLVVEDNTEHYNVVRESLWLSGGAPPGALLRKAAERRSTGC